MKWNNLSMKEKAECIKLSIKNNITNLDTIKNIYNKLSEGGFIDNTVVNSNKEKEWLSNWYSSRQDKLTPLYKTNPELIFKPFSK